MPAPRETAPATGAGDPAGRPADAGSAAYRFRLFIAGPSPLSRRVRENFARYVADPLGDRVEVEVVDLVEDPRVARTERIVATPTLVRVEPAPVVRLVGDLTDFDRVRALVLLDADRPPAGSPAGAPPAGREPAA